MKKRLKTTAMVLCVMLVLSGCSSSAMSETELMQLPSYTIEGSFSYDTSDLRQVIGFAKYVFVAEVISYDGSRLEDVAYREDEKQGKVKLGSPYTDYTVRVTENIKGQLKINETLKIKKDGGLAPDGESVYVWENDELPRTGETYVFCATQETDGTLLVCGPSSNVLVSSGREKETIDKYKKAYADQIIPKEE